MGIRGASTCFPLPATSRVLLPMTGALFGGTGDPRHPVLTPKGVTVMPIVPEAQPPPLPVSRAELPSTQLAEGWTTQAQRVPKAFPHVFGPLKFPIPAPFPLSSEKFSHLCLDNPAMLKSSLLPTMKVMLSGAEGCDESFSRHPGALQNHRGT